MHRRRLFLDDPWYPFHKGVCVKNWNLFNVHFTLVMILMIIWFKTVTHISEASFRDMQKLWHDLITILKTKTRRILTGFVFRAPKLFINWSVVVCQIALWKYIRQQLNTWRPWHIETKCIMYKITNMAAGFYVNGCRTWPWPCLQVDTHGVDHIKYSGVSL